MQRPTERTFNPASEKGRRARFLTPAPELISALVALDDFGGDQRVTVEPAANELTPIP